MKKKVLLLGTIFPAELPLFFELKESVKYDPFIVTTGYPSFVNRYDHFPYANLPKIMNFFDIRKYKGDVRKYLLDIIKPDVIILRCWVQSLYKLSLPNTIFWKIESPVANKPNTIQEIACPSYCSAFLTQNKEELPFYKGKLKMPVGYFPRGVSHFWEKPLLKTIDIIATGTASTKGKINSYIKLVKPLCALFNSEQLHIYQNYGQRNIPWAKEYFRPCYFAEDGPKVMASAKILISPITPRYDKGIISHKAIQGMGCRTLVITEKTPGLEDIVGKSGENIIYVESSEECVDKVKYYLKHDSEREEISERAYKFVHNEYNYTKIFERAMKEVGVL